MRLRLKGKTVICTVLFAFLLGAIALIAVIIFMNRVIDERYREDVDTISHITAVSVDREAAARLSREVMGIYRGTGERVSSSERDTPGWTSYQEQYQHVAESEDFKNIRAQLAVIQDSCDVSNVYLFCLDAESMAAIYLVDASEGEDYCPPGCIDQVFFSGYKEFEDPENGFPPYISDTDEYGWLVTAGAPVVDADGEVICYAGVDIPMEIVRARQMRFVFIVSGLLILATILVAAAGVILMDRQIVRPIKCLSEAAQKYCEEDSNAVHDRLSDLDVRTGDEIEMLADSMKKMEQDLNTYITKMVETRSRLVSTMREAEKMGRIATMDSLTGIRNKTAYDSMVEKIDAEIAEGKDRFGVVMIDLNYLKKINDTCGHEKGDQTIRHLCQLVCATYQHSPVFRIGGDEFVVILSGRDYDNEQGLTEKLNQTLDALARDESSELWERVSAAIGCALYDPKQDTCFEDVFRRADRQMYDRKRDMKVGRV